MKIQVEAKLFKDGHCVDLWGKTCSSVKKAVASLEECPFSEDSGLHSSFKLFWDDKTLVFEGAWIFLRQLANIEDAARKEWKGEYESLWNKEIEDYLQRFLYEPKVWLIQEWLDEVGDKYIKGLFKGTQREARDFCNKFKTDISCYSFHHIDFMN